MAKAVKNNHNILLPRLIYSLIIYFSVANMGGIVNGFYMVNIGVETLLYAFTDKENMVYLEKNCVIFYRGILNTKGCI